MVVYGLFIVVAALLGALAAILLHKPKILTVYVYSGVLTTLYLAISALMFQTAPAQLDTIGFAARNHNPNHFLYILSYAVAAYAVLSIYLIYKKPKVYSLTNLAILLILSVFLYFTSW